MLRAPMRLPLRALAFPLPLLLRLAFSLPLVLLAVPARADEPEVPEDLPRLLLDTGRAAPEAPDPDALRFVVHGEEQIRAQAQRSFTLVPTASRVASRPGLAADSLGQNWFVSHWLRVTPRLLVRDTLELVAQVDVVTGLLFGQQAHDTSADLTPRDELNGYYNVQPRWLYAQYKLPFGMVRIGQQPNHWGMGILANDGDHPTLFGDYRYGAISERLLFATRPGGKDSDFVLAVAGDLVFRDNNARLTRGQQALQGVVAAYWEKGWNKLGLFSTLRHQENDRISGSALFPYSDRLDAFAVDLHGRVAAPVPGEDAFVFGEAEVATIFGSTNLLRTPAQALEDAKTTIRSYGGAAAFGFVHRAHERGFGAKAAKETSAAPGVAFGDLVAQVEVGYASGDADPYDGVEKRFVFDPNHRVGLLLFDEVLRFQTARSATAAQDPLLVNATRGAPGADALPSNGGVYGAQYVTPTVVVRPRHWLDVKGGLVVAQATSDVVDPYRVVVNGTYANGRGGSPKARDLGVELDAGFEARVPLDYGLLAQLGAQGGLLFPGMALADDRGEGLPVQWLAVGRLGLLF